MRGILVLTVLVALLSGCQDEERGAAAPVATPGTPTERVDYVALGDSFSAGPLIPLARNDASGCFRSTNNYPAYLAQLLEVTTYADATCSGATTDDLLRRQRVPGSTRPAPQLDALSAETDVVTLGIGGNDGGLFGGVLACSDPRSVGVAGAPCRERYTAPDGGDVAVGLARAAGANVARSLREIADRAPHAEVLVVGYPRLLPEDGTCRTLGLSDADVAWGRGVEVALDRALRRAAARGGATYVGLRAASRGHDICAGADAWVNGRRPLTGRALAFHPFQEGMRAVAGVVYEALTGTAAPTPRGDAAPPAGSITRS